MHLRTEREIIIWDDIVMMILALASGYLLLLEFTTSLTAAQAYWFPRIDIAIAGAFLVEFVIKFLFAESKSEFFRGNWWYLLASIPISTPTTQTLRLLRLFSFVRLIRLMRLTVGVREVLEYMERFVKQTHILYVLTTLAVIVLLGSSAFYAFEHPINTNVRTLFDSLWFTIATVTTVGYGDIYPMTVGGRVVGMFLMICGIGTTGIFTALVASFLIKEK